MEVLPTTKMNTIALFKRGKKGQMGGLVNLIVGSVVFAITAVVVFLIMAQLAANTQVVADGNATAAVEATQSAAEDIPGWLPIIIVTFIGVILLSLIRNIRS